MERKDMPYSGVECDEKKRECKIWYAQTKDSQIKTIEIKMPVPIPMSKDAFRQLENDIDTLLHDSKADIQG